MHVVMIKTLSPHCSEVLLSMFDSTLKFLLYSNLLCHNRVYAALLDESISSGCYDTTTLRPPLT